VSRSDRTRVVIFIGQEFAAEWIVATGVEENDRYFGFRLYDAENFVKRKCMSGERIPRTNIGIDRQQ
jgi:hypothetical protein